MPASETDLAPGRYAYPGFVPPLTLRVGAGLGGRPPARRLLRRPPPGRGRRVQRAVASLYDRPRRGASSWATRRPARRGGRPSPRTTVLARGAGPVGDRRRRARRPPCSGSTPDRGRATCSAGRVRRTPSAAGSRVPADVRPGGWTAARRHGGGHPPPPDARVRRGRTRDPVGAVRLIARGDPGRRVVRCRERTVHLPRHAALRVPVRRLRADLRPAPVVRRGVARLHGLRLRRGQPADLPDRRTGRLRLVGVHAVLRRGRRRWVRLRRSLRLRPQLTIGAGPDASRSAGRTAGTPVRTAAPRRS